MTDKKRPLTEGLQGAGKMKPAQLITRPAKTSMQNSLSGADRLQAKPKPAPQPTPTKGEKNGK